MIDNASITTKISSPYVTPKYYLVGANKRVLITFDLPFSLV